MVGTSFLRTGAGTTKAWIVGDRISWLTAMCTASSCCSLDGSYAAHERPEALEEIVKQEQETHWRQVEAPQPGDVVVLRVMGRHSHVGLVLGGGGMLHAQEGTRGMRRALRRRDCGASRVEDFWRHESRA